MKTEKIKNDTSMKQSVITIDSKVVKSEVPFLLQFCAYTYKRGTCNTFTIK